MNSAQRSRSFILVPQFLIYDFIHKSGGHVTPPSCPMVPAPMETIFSVSPMNASSTTIKNYFASQYYYTVVTVIVSVTAIKMTDL